MRIAHVTATFPPNYSGTGLVCYYNALELAKRGHQVTVFTSKYPVDNYSDPAEITIRRLPPAFQIGNAPFLHGLIHEIKDFDIVHLHHPFIFGSEMIWAVSILRNIPLIVTHHNDLIANGILRSVLFNSYSAISTRLVFGRAHTIIAVSLDHAKGSRLSRIFHDKWEHVIEIPNGVDVQLFQPRAQSRDIRIQQNIPADAHVVLFVGALDRAHHYRRVDVLIEAISKINNPNVHLVLAGDGDLLAEFKRMAANLEIMSRVHFLGKVPHHKLPEVYSIADIVVLPSQIQESFGMVLIEAMASGKPVIATNLPGVRTVVTDGIDGLLVQACDSFDLSIRIQELLDDPQKRRVMGQLGRVKVEQQYAWPIVVDKLEKLYAEVLDSRMKDKVLNPDMGKFRNS